MKYALTRLSRVRPSTPCRDVGMEPFALGARDHSPSSEALLRIHSPRHALLYAMTCLLVLTFSSLPCIAAESVRLVLHWYPQAQFTGYYMAVEKGFYAQHGLDVQLIPGGADINPLNYLEQGKADFATTFLSTAIKRRDAGLDLVHVGQVVHDSALILVTRKGQGITKLADFDGKKIGMWGADFQIQPRALFKRLGVQVDVVQQSSSMDLFMRGGLDAVMAMWYNEYHTLLSYGLDAEDMNAFFFRDLDLNFPEDSIYCLKSTALERPETVKALLQGTKEGWEYTFEHPEEALETMLRIMKEQRVRANRSHQQWMLARMRDIILSQGRKTVDLSLTKEKYERIVATMRNDGAIQEAPAFDEFIWQVRP